MPPISPKKISPLQAAFIRSCGGLKPSAATVGPFGPNKWGILAQPKLLNILGNLSAKLFRKLFRNPFGNPFGNSFGNPFGYPFGNQFENPL